MQDQPVSRVSLGKSDIDQIFEWNKNVPKPFHTLLHVLVEEKAAESPEAPAVHGWDGKFTYAELDKASNALAHRLAGAGVAEETMIPVCFEKSVWAIVALLGILKAGCAFVPLDPSQPPLRRSKIISQCGAKVSVTSASCSNLFSNNVRPLIVDRSILKDVYSASISRAVSPGSPAYVMFTSGSTGMPKGAVISHRAICTSLKHRARPGGFTAQSRMLQFAAPVFDALLDEAFMMLSVGGCICVPSDKDKLDGLSQSIVDLEVNTVVLTPTVGRLLDPKGLPGLQNVTLAGETVSQYDITRWGPSRKIVVGYGPTECSVMCVYHTVDFHHVPSIGIMGDPITCVGWIVDPDDPNTLVPIGEVGELLVEGHILADGYLDDPQRTNESFIESPDWLVHKLGRSGKLYKTGDLVRYNHNGGFSFVERKDTQVKIHGQRVELGEIESYITNHLMKAGTVVDIVTLSDSNTVLAAFIQTNSLPTVAVSEGAGETCALEVLLDTADLIDRLSQSVPEYMIPSVFFALRDLPRTISGKADRRALCQSASAFTLSRLNQVPKSIVKMGPVNSREHTLQQIWARVLMLEPSRIGVNDSFFRLGGDSITAVMVTNQARKNGIEITVADMLRHPKLGDSAIVASERHRAQEPRIKPFSLLKASVDVAKLRDEIAHEYGIDISAIEDILPCTPLQEGLLSLTDRYSGDYMFQFTLHISDGVDIPRLRRAWETVVALLPILRTRMVSTRENGIHQVVLRGAVRWEESDDLQGYLQRGKNEPMGLGDPLTRYAIVRSTSANPSLAWTIHHSLYDGWSVQRMLALVERAYQGLVGLSEPKDYSTFIKYLQDHNDDKAKGFWKSYLANCEAAQFPTVHLSQKGTKNKTWRRNLLEDERPVTFPESSSYLPTTLIRAALSILISQLTASDEVVFGTTVFGRYYPIDDMEDIVGPTIATVPVRANLSEAEAPTISSLLDSLQEKATSMIPYEQYGLQNIMQLSRDCQAACNFQTHLTVQLENYESLNTPTLGHWEKPKSLLTSLNTYPLMIECFFNSSGIRMQVSYDLDALSTGEVERIVEQFYHTLSQLLQADPKAKLRDIRIDPLPNIQQIWKWNETVPEPVDGLLHGLFEETANKLPHSSPAVRGWDKDFTYAELDKASTSLACRLTNLGVVPGTAVLLCFEKSAWAIVAMLGILKVGAKFVPLDPSQPVYRREKIIKQSSGRVIVTSAAYSKDFNETETVVVLDQSTLQRNFDTRVLPSRVHAEDPAYIMFTSGTTGEPKGVVVRHQAICTSIKLRAARQGFGPRSRVLQFSSYTFDTMIDEIFMTLHVGGCICVLSDGDRQNDLSSAIVNLRVNTIGLTPTVARLLDPHEVPEVDSVILWGEAVLHHDVARWSHVSRVMVGYGPTECCVLSAQHRVTDVDAFLSGSIIGKAAASVCWVVDPPNHNRLAPLGGIGELLVEGPALSVGYLNNAETTAASFVEDPEWLLRGSTDAAGRRGRLYKTGDLVKYTGDGNLCYIGRKDTQIKIHGQRVELGEVEHCVGLCIPEATKVVAEVLKLGGNTALAVVIQITGHGSKTALNVMGDVPHLEALPSKRETEEKLSHCLPRYMVPSAFFVINDIPKMASGKVNRKLIRELISEFKSRSQAGAQDIRVNPTGSVERKLHQIWAEILRLAPDAIDINSNFFQLGGNSIAAMKISNRARKQGIAITVADMFRHPKLVDSAAAAGNKTITQTVKVPPFSLLDEPKYSTIETLRAEVARAYHFDPTGIEDLLPCTPLQEGLLSLTNRDHGDYIVQFVLDILESVQLEKLRMAWNRVMRMLPILRTRIVSVSTGQSKLHQAIIQEESSWTETSDLQAYLEHDKSLLMRLGDPLARYAIVHDSVRKKRYLVLTLHHSLYDGWSAQRMLAMVERAYQGISPGQPQDFRIFIKYLKDNNNQQAEKFWKSHLAGCQAPHFPAVHLTENTARKRDLFEEQRPVTFKQRLNHFPSAFIRGAMSILISRLTVSSEVIFGGTVFGRHYAIDGIEDVIGPTIATVPIRVKLEKKQTVLDFLNSVQEHATEMIPYEQFGIQNIERLSRDCQAACNFLTHLTIQPEEYQSVHTESLGTWSRPSGLLTSLNTYPLMIECFLDSTGLKTQVNFDTTVVSASEVKRIVDQFYHTIEQLMQADESVLVSEIDIDPPSNIQQIWTWNRTVPEQVNELLHTPFQKKAAERPDALAIHGWDGDFTYSQLDEVSTRLAIQLHKAGVTCGTVVPMCIEKSIWAVVAMLGILKAGGAFVPIGPIQPAPRREKILEETSAQIVVTSGSCSSLIKSSGHRRLVIASPSSLVEGSVADQPPSSTPPELPAYIIFTSGSTGEPKGVVVEHKAVCTSIAHRVQDRGYGPDTRTLQFASYTFDAMIDEIFMTFYAGGCVCIPSEDDSANVSKAIVDLEANSLCLTPTVSRLIAPNDVPSIKSIILWGEPVFNHDIARWKHVPTVMVGYGPTECCVACAHYVVDPQNIPPESLIGHAAASTTWIVDHENHGKLAPIGAIGELMIEGHALARGYLNDAQKTSDSFIEDPEWLLRGADDISGRHGMLYKTGDLVRYNVDGSIAYIRRKDTQVKINGQRVELGEVESHMVQHMPAAEGVVADVVTFSDDHTALVAFVKMKQRNRIAEHVLTRNEVSLWLIKSSIDLTRRLFEQLPRHMVPSVLLAVDHIPKTISGKADRRLLRDVAGDLTLSNLNQTSSCAPKKSPTNIKEEKLQKIWSEILRLEPSMIGVDESFFQLGGNSIAAMKVSAAARQIGWSLPVSEIFRCLNISTLSARLPELPV